MEPDSTRQRPLVGCRGSLWGRRRGSSEKRPRSPRTSRSSLPFAPIIQFTRLTLARGATRVVGARSPKVGPRGSRSGPAGLGGAGRRASWQRREVFDGLGGLQGHGVVAVVARCGLFGVVGLGQLHHARRRRPGGRRTGQQGGQASWHGVIEHAVASRCRLLGVAEQLRDRQAGGRRAGRRGSEASWHSCTRPRAHLGGHRNGRGRGKRELWDLPRPTGDGSVTPSATEPTSAAAVTQLFRPGLALHQDAGHQHRGSDVQAGLGLENGPERVVGPVGLSPAAWLTGRRGGRASWHRRSRACEGLDEQGPGLLERSRSSCRSRC